MCKKFTDIKILFISFLKFELNLKILFYLNFTFYLILFINVLFFIYIFAKVKYIN